jgi:hypothetical protein
VFPRGNWKTSTSALIGLHHLLWVEHASVALAAGSREQARIAGAILSTHVRAFPALVLRHDEVRAPSGLLRVIAADGGRAHGRTDTLMIGDEVWSWPEREPSLLNAFETALVKIPTARLLLISTSAAQLDSPLGRMRARALAGEVKRSGAFIDAPAEGLRWLEWSVPESQSLRSDHAVKLANPAPTITPARSANSARGSPSLRSLSSMRAAGASPKLSGCRPVPGRPAGMTSRSRMASRRSLAST